VPEKFNIEINPGHDWEAHAQTLQQDLILQIPNFFTDETAEYLFKLLVENKDWHLAYNDGENFYESSMAQLGALTPQQRQGFMNNIYARARSQFQYVFNQYFITQAIANNEQPGHPMHQMEEFMNSQEMLDLMRKLTGEPAVAKADTYASTYLPGHFLTTHDDKHASHDRVAAYVFSMTKGWDTNWGGHLAFFDEKGNATKSFVPAFNTLNMFMIPQMHAVQFVAPFAGVKRVSYLGWLHR
jgi:Rps23 Pro-64 3,4-dihydroxylase Tpa1-like proline 4-hydroxylase